jgi:hypothetical protein
MPRIKNTFKKGSSYHIVDQVYHELEGKVDKKDIEDIINKFWGMKFGVLKYLNGFKSFSVKRMLFFPVYKSKLPEYLKQKEIKRKKQIKYIIDWQRKKRREKKRQEKTALHKRWKEEKKQKWLDEMEENKRLREEKNKKKNL